MCGLTGIWAADALSRDETLAVLTRMRDRLTPRGPDAAGIWNDEPAGLWLAHRRLSIIDLSPHGHQPMVSGGERFVIAYNGEVYNFASIRRELDESGLGPAHWRGGSDTEVVLTAIEAWGLEPALQRFVGMFAFALWDRRDRLLHLVRDRLGIKPLCHGRAGRSLVFGSTLAALREHPGFDASIDRSALAAYLRFNCVPAPHTIYTGAVKVRPGTLVTFSGPGGEAHETVWWSAASVLAEQAANPLTLSDVEARDELERVLTEAVRARMIADVPLGAFLSGGIDSSTVVALMQLNSDRPVRTFSIGNERADYDESRAAAAVARHLGTDHTELVVTAADALAVVPELPRVHDEPFSDSSQIPTFLVSRLARQDVTVALSGDGGDELFGGYNRHLWGPRVWRSVGWIPRNVKRAMARGIESVSPQRWDRLFDRAPLPSVRLPGDKLHKLASVLGAADAEAMYMGLQTHWTCPASLVLGAGAEAERPDATPPSRDLASRMMFQDLIGYLPDDILTKVDRASMAVSLEARVPILDHRVVELAWRLPMAQKIRRGTGKHLLREVLARHVPRRLWERSKMGFGVPIGEWLRNELRPWAEELLAERRLRSDGIFVPGPIRERWTEHLRGTRNWQHHLWDVLVFQAWLDETRSRARGDVSVEAVSA